MSKDSYLEYKKQTLISLIEFYNQGCEDSRKFEIDKENLDIKKTFTSKRCQECCGGCCSTYPCVFSPKDFLDVSNIEYMEGILKTGLLTISLVKSRNTYNYSTYCLRIRGRSDSLDNCKSRIMSAYFDYRNHNKYNYCLLKDKEKGCMLPPEYRPSEALLYMPNDEGHRHRTMYTTRQIEDDWYEYQDILRLLGLKLGGIEFSESVSEEQVKTFIKKISNIRN